MAQKLAPVDVLEDWLVREGHLSEKVQLRDYEAYIESEHMRIFLCVRRDRHYLMNPDGPSFNLEIPFDEDTLFSILEFALQAGL